MKEFTQDELEIMSYDDLAHLILKDANKKMKITDLFTKVAKIVKLTDKEYENQIADFYELISTDKRFILLEKGYCDLRVNHSHKIVIEEDDEDYVEDISEEDKEDKEEEAEDSYETDVDPEDDITDDDLDDLVVVTDDEDAEELN